MKRIALYALALAALCACGGGESDDGAQRIGSPPPDCAATPTLCH